MLKKLLFISAAFVSFAGLCRAQWCVPNTIIPYSSAMPGITNVTINTINRTSNDLENYPNNNYVNTGLSTTLQIGIPYTISITHTIDASICPDMNLRVYIDYNNDFQLDDPGEIVISTDHHAPGTYTGTFTIPASVSAGSKRMRVAAKMSNLGGHTAPTPCDLPPDPFGYHGEMEDYTVNITAVTGITEAHTDIVSFDIYPNPMTDHALLIYDLKKQALLTIQVFNALGQNIFSQARQQAAGPHQVQLNSLISFTPGLYLVSILTAEDVIAKRVLVPVAK